VDLVFEIFPPLLFKADPALMTFFVSVAHEPSSPVLPKLGEQRDTLVMLAPEVTYFPAQEGLE
jgi:hypothetical protein